MDKALELRARIAKRLRNRECVHIGEICIQRKVIASTFGDQERKVELATIVRDEK